MSFLMYKRYIYVLTLFVLLVVGWQYISKVRNEKHENSKKEQLDSVSRQVQSLPSVQEPSVFTRQFNPNRQIAVSLEVQGLEGRTIKSPFYPYEELQTHQVQSEVPSYIIYAGEEEINMTSEVRYYNVDPYWNVFWVEIAPPGKSTAFYGPFRLDE